jgi:uncharacterized protein YraI
MRRTVIKALTVGAMAAMIGTGSAQAAGRDRHAVYGVEDGDMLKMRTGPGIGFDVIVGLPNGTIVRVRDCEQTGSTRWCRVSLDRAPGLRGYVSSAYLQEI